jgi:hypothetical protein
VRCIHIKKYAHITCKWHFCDEQGGAKDLPALKTITVDGLHEQWEGHISFCKLCSQSENMEEPKKLFIQQVDPNT